MEQISLGSPESIAVVVSICSVLISGVGIFIAARATASSVKSANAAEHSLALAVEEQRRSRTAQLKFLMHYFSWADTADSNKVFVTTGIRNEGNSDCYGLSLSIFLHASGRHTFGQSCVKHFDERESQKLIDTLAPFRPGAVQLFNHEVFRNDFGDSTGRHITLCLLYRDGTGQHSHHMKIWLGGVWENLPPTFSQVSECLDGQFIELGPKTSAAQELRQVGVEHDFPCKPLPSHLIVF